MLSLTILSLSLQTTVLFVHAQSIISPQSLAASLSLTTSTSYPFPTSTLLSPDASNYVAANWGVSHERFQDGTQDFTFVDDPFPNNPAPGPGSSNATSPVIQVTYPAGSVNDNTGGAQFVTLWNNTDSSVQFETMMVSYEIAFNSSFEPVLGGKLPGLRGGINTTTTTGCSGGTEATGDECFSARLMWRKAFAGEIYAYIPEETNLCDAKGVICNSDFGISLQRGAFTFQTAQWSRVTLVARMNDPPTASNGLFALYFNDVLAINQENLQIRTSSAVSPMGLYFSTFFGGNNASYATPIDTATYFRNFQLWASTSSAAIAIPSGSSQSPSSTSSGNAGQPSVSTTSSSQKNGGNVLVLEWRSLLSAVVFALLPLIVHV